ncbi:putative S-protein [Cardamine amara subsp. amara]|uniref:S-protein n=1 Tax=Cardamine amara subsp. amara TaxID=228776 RepID=A0ABD1C207_CARAN
MMNRLLCFLLVITLCAWLSDTSPVQFKNSLIPKVIVRTRNVLKIHCLSDGDDLGNQYVRPDETYNTTINDSTYICELWAGRGYEYYAKLKVEISGEAEYKWEATHDWIFFTHGQERFKYKWTYIP